MRMTGALSGFLVVISLSLALARPVSAESNRRILFTSTRDGSSAKIYVMDPDGLNVRRLGSLPGEHLRPQFSRDNRKILFTYLATIPGNRQIYIMNADGSGVKALTSDPLWNWGVADFTWDDRIVYLSYSGNWYIMDIDGSHKRPFSLEVPGMGKVGEHGSFMFGPNGMVVFTHNEFVKGFFVEQIFKVSADGTGLVRLIESPETYTLPSWCADGTRIAYAKTGLSIAGLPSRHDRDGIYQMSAGGTNRVRIVEVDFSRIVGWTDSFIGLGRSGEPVSLFREPSFSRDCKMLTFSLNLEGPGQVQVYVVNSDGSGMRRLTGPPGWNSDPVFSH